MSATAAGRPTKIALVDVDGTLTDTVAVDLRCYLETLHELFGFSADPGDYDWEAYTHASDPGLLGDAFAQFAGRPPSAAEAETFLRRFLQALGAAAHRDPADFRAVAGAGGLVAALKAAPDWHLAVATGCWAESAILKLELAGLACVGPPLASASDAVSRRQIFALARARAGDLGAGPAAVLLGDGVWDAETACDLGLPFVGVARADRAAALERRGAAAVVPDFRDLEGALRTLEGAIEGARRAGSGA